MEFKIAKEIVLMAIESNMIKPIGELSACKKFANNVIDLFFMAYKEIDLPVQDPPMNN